MDVTFAQEQINVKNSQIEDMMKSILEKKKLFEKKNKMVKFDSSANLKDSTQVFTTLDS